MEIRETSANTGEASAPPATHTLDSLAEKTSDELAEVYASGTVPKTFEVLKGHPRGRMLAVRSLDRGAVAEGLRRFAAGSFFPWGGKSFVAHADRISGINRVHLFGRHLLFPFQLKNQASEIDQRPCIALDYDLEDNPAPIRKIHDEIREVSPGVFLGPAMFRGKRAHTLILWFALDTNLQATPVGES